MNHHGSSSQRQADDDQATNLSPELQEVLHMLDVIEHNAQPAKPGKR